MYIFWVPIKDVFCVVDVKCFTVNYLTFEQALKIIITKQALEIVQKNPTQLFLI